MFWGGAEKALEIDRADSFFVVAFTYNADTKNQPKKRPDGMRNFSKVIDCAMIAYKNSGHEIDDDFVEVNKIVKAGATTKKDLESRDKILDFTGSEELIANLFRISQTESKLKRENIQDVTAAGDAHYKIGREVCKSVGNSNSVAFEIYTHHFNPAISDRLRPYIRPRITTVSIGASFAT